MSGRFRKWASMTKRAPAISRIGTFYSGGSPLSSVLLEVADDDESRRRGLMWRTSLPPICGMLFEGLRGGGFFWMKNCLIPLDVAFMDDGGVVTRTYSMPIDEDGREALYEYGEDDVSAVEVAMGCLGRWGVGVGCRLATRRLSGKGGGSNG